MSEEGKLNYPGQILREARKKKRRRYRKLSSELGIPEKYLEALEEDNFSILAGPTYVRGYLRAYSKKLELDPELVLKAYDKYLKDQKKEEKKSKKKEREVKRKGHFSLLYKITVILILAITVFMFLSNDEAEIENNKESNSASKMEIEISKGSSLDATFESETLKEQTLREDIEILRENSTTLMEEESIVRKEKNEDINAIRMNFSGDCWIEIMDKKTVLEYKLAKAGTSIYLKGEGPFKVIIGHSKRAELFYNDTQISLASTTNVQTNVSCLVLPKGRCDEFALSN